MFIIVIDLCDREWIIFFIVYVTINAKDNITNIAMNDRVKFMLSMGGYKLFGLVFLLLVLDSNIAQE